MQESRRRSNQLIRLIVGASGAGHPLVDRLSFLVSLPSANSVSETAVPPKWQTRRVRAIAANTARIRLWVKIVIARLAQSPGTSGRVAERVAPVSRTRLPTSGKRFRAGLHRFNMGIGARKSLTGGACDCGLRDSRATVSRDAISGWRFAAVVRMCSVWSRVRTWPRAFQMAS
jgi:hypothetical protein